MSPVGTSIENGTALNNAIAAANALVPPPSATARALVFVEPGVYARSFGFSLGDYVSLKGSGVKATKIVGSSGVIGTTSSDDNEISDLWVEITSASGKAIAYNVGTFIHDVRVTAPRGANGIDDAAGFQEDLRIERVLVETTTGFAMNVTADNTTIRDSTIPSGGVGIEVGQTAGSSVIDVRMQNVDIEATSHAIDLVKGTATVTGSTLTSTSDLCSKL